MTAITKVYTQGAEKKFSDKHPFQKYFEEVEVGDSLETAGRTVTEADAEEELKRNMADWTKDKADETRWNIKSLQKGIDKLVEEINGVKLDNELKKKTTDIS